MQKRVMIELDEGLQRHIQPLAVIQHGVVVIGNPPWPRIDVESLLEFAGLRGAAEFGEFIAAAQGPVAAARPAVEFQDLDFVAGLAQLQSRGHPGKSGAENENGRALRIALELYRPLVSGLGGEAERGHRMDHRSTFGYRADPRKQIAAAWCACRFVSHFLRSTGPP